MNFLKLALATLALSSSFAANAETKGGSDIGSAFVNGSTLYVTVLGDCNSMSGTLEVAPICNDKRLTKNFAVECEAQLSIQATELFCGGFKQAHVIEIDLKKTDVAREAQVLNLDVMGRTLKIRLK